MTIGHALLTAAAVWYGIGLGTLVVLLGLSFRDRLRGAGRPAQNKMKPAESRMPHVILPPSNHLGIAKAVGERHLRGLHPSGDRPAGPLSSMIQRARPHHPRALAGLLAAAGCVAVGGWLLSWDPEPPEDNFGDTLGREG
jgi:hypothetical protein